MIEGTLALRARFDEAAQTLAGCERLIVTGCGVDEITARELALKIEEGRTSRSPRSGSRRSCTATCPPPTSAPASSSSGSTRRAPQRDKRAARRAAAVEVLGMPTVTIDGLPEGHPLLAGAIALQLLTLELVHAPAPTPT